MGGPDTGPSRGGDALGRALEAAENTTPSDALGAVTHELREALGAKDAAFLAADLTGRGLVRLTRATSRDEERDPPNGLQEFLPLEGGPRDDTLSTQKIQVVAGDDDTWTVLAPVTERGEALGLLEMVLPAEPDEETLGEISRTAHLLAFVVIANRRHTDLFEESRRRTPYTLAAEIQRRLLPEASTCEGGSFTLSAWLEPAASVGGDTFDYSLGAGVLHLSMTDAMGHGTDSALTATLCVGSLRNSRRSGADLLEQVTEANRVLAERFESTEGFVTGLVGRVDLHTGILSLVNAGHVGPYLVRDGKVQSLEFTRSLPLGIYDDAEYETEEIGLRPGDRIVLVTDGLVERSAVDLDLSASLLEVNDLHPREATRRLADKVLELSGDELADDASLLVLDWHGGGQGRNTNAGSDVAAAPDAST